MRNFFESCRRFLKFGVLAQAAAFMLSASAVMEAEALSASAPMAETEAVGMYIADAPYKGRSVLYKDTTYVELGELTAELNVCSRSWDSANETAFYAGEGITMTVTDGLPYLEANGRYLWCENGVFADADGVYVPLRAAAKALGAEVHWDAESFSAHVIPGDAPILSGDRFYVSDEVHWLSRIIYAEAGVEPFLGQIAVGNVVLNRVRSEVFPDTIYAVIFDRNYGVQFTPTANGTIYNTPDAEAIIAAKLCLEGYSISHEILYFLNAALAENLWVPRNRPYVMTISGHDFYS